MYKIFSHAPFCYIYIIVTPYNATLMWPYAFNVDNSTYKSQRVTKIAPQKYFPQTTPPSSAFPKIERFRLIMRRAMAIMAAMV